MSTEPASRPHGPWRILDTQAVYRDPWIEVDRDRVVRPDGAPGTHVVVRMKPGVSVLPLDDEGRVYLTDEFHYGVGRRSIEAVSGGIEPGETPESTAHRELAEELGIHAARLVRLTTVDPFTTIVVSPTVLFIAEGLSFAPARPEGTEQIDRAVMSLDEAKTAVLEGRITHAPSCILVLQAWLRRES